MKKKILFIMPSMFIGGAERSLLGLLETIDYSKTDVSLFLYRHEGELLQHIPEQVNLLPEMKQYRTFDVPIKSLLFSNQVHFAIARIASKIALHIHRLTTKEKRGVWMSMQYTSHYLQSLLSSIPGEYDLAIMFLGVSDTLINKVQAKRKLAWCHTDYDSLGPSRKMDMDVYRQVDHVVAVSEDCAAKIRSTYPEIADKVIVIENILPEQLLKRQVGEPIVDMQRKEGVWNILSIGRYSEAKNFDNIPAICRKIRELGIDANWYIIGYGGDEGLIKQRIAEAGMENHVILLGKKENPYPYIKVCDLYVQPSRYEGKCVTVREAQLLGKPVVITRYATSASQLEEGVDGMIVPMDNEGCAAGIAELLQNPARMAQLVEACKKRDYSNAKEAKKLEQLMQ